MQIVEAVDGRLAASVCEKFHIASMLLDGHDLLNGTPGGDGYQLWNDRQMQRHSKRMQEYWSRAAARTKQSEAMQAFYSSGAGAVEREKKRATGKLAKARQTYTPEAREKMRAAKLGKPQMARTAEWKAKISAAQKGKTRRPWTDEERARHAAGLNREAMSAAAKARWAAKKDKT